MPGGRRRGLALAVACAAALAPAASRAQFQPFERPGEIRPELPPVAPPEQPEFTLPPVPEAGPEERRRLSRGPRIAVREYRVTGSTIYSDAQIANVTAPYTGRPVGTEELQELRDRLTRLYVDAGYLNSGAVLPDQDVADGVVEYRIVEGRLADVAVEGNRRFRDAYLRRRIERGAHTPLRVGDLEHELQLLQQDPRIRRVEAALLPGDRPGEARLRARFEEAVPYYASLEFSNHESPSIGATGVELYLGHRNLTGNGDVLRGNLQLTRGLGEYEAGYEIPVTSRDTTVGAWFQYGRSDVVEDPFEELDIESESKTVGLELRQPVYRTAEDQLELALLAEWEESETFLLGEPFPFGEGTDDGRSVVSVARFRQDWLHRDLRQVVAARSQLSVGLGVLGATENPGSIPDGRFVAWLGQFQWVRRFDPWAWEVLFRTDLQLASSPLLSLEQFSLGGVETVRGYRENQLVRDDGLVSSLELRIPLWREASGRSWIQIAPFFDVGRSWNTERGEVKPRTLVGTGVGLRGSFTRHLSGDVYWAQALRDVDEPEDWNLQDASVYFSLTASF